MSMSLNGRRHFWNFSVSGTTVSNKEDPGGEKAVDPFHIFCLNLNPLTGWCAVFSVRDMFSY